MGWMEEEFEASGTPFGKRGKRADEMIELLRALWTGEVVEHHGAHFDLPPLEMLPAPTEPVPGVVGGVAEAALRGAARNAGGGRYHPPKSAERRVAHACVSHEQPRGI